MSKTHPFHTTSSSHPTSDGEMDEWGIEEEDEWALDAEPTHPM